MAQSTLVTFPTAEQARRYAIGRGVQSGADLQVPGKATAWVVVSTTFGGAEYVAVVTGCEKAAWTAAADAARSGVTRVEAHPFL